jgi:hypothetical protein
MTYHPLHSTQFIREQGGKLGINSSSAELSSTSGKQDDYICLQNKEMLGKNAYKNLETRIRTLSQAEN